MVASLWTVPDAATSVLMYLFHDFRLRAHEPVDALHAAQLWMLRPIENRRRPCPTTCATDSPRPTPATSSRGRGSSMPDESLRAAAERAAAIGGDEWPWAFARCWLLAFRFDGHGHDRKDLDEALAAFAEIPADAPGRSRLAAVLVNLTIIAGGLRTPEDIDPVAELAAIADKEPQPFPQWPADRSVVRALWLMISLTYGRAGIDPRTAATELDRLAAVVGERRPHAQMINAATGPRHHARGAARPRPGRRSRRGVGVGGIQPRGLVTYSASPYRVSGR